MNRQQSIFIYILSFVIISILLKAFGIVDFTNIEILGYALMFYGISLVFISFGTDMRGSLFLGTSVFLAGVLFFLLNHFTFLDPTVLILPSIFFICGISFLMLFLDDTGHKVLIYISSVFIATGVVITLLWGAPDFISFLRAIPEIFIRLLPLTVIIILLLLLLRGKQRG